VELRAFAALLGLAAAAAGAGPQEPGPTQPVPPPPSPLTMKRPARTPPAEIEALFRRILDFHRPQPGPPRRDAGGCTLFEQQLSGHAREVRLFAHAFPDPAVRLAVGRLEDPAAPAHERVVALLVLLPLAPRGTPALEKVLLDIIAAGDEHLRPFAVGNLAARDPSGKHREIYRALCRKGDATSFDAVLRFLDAGTRPFLKELAAIPRGVPYPEGQAPPLAERALADLDLLESPDRVRRLEERILTFDDDLRIVDLSRTIEHARQIGMRNVKEILARRLAPTRAAFAGADPAAAASARTWEKEPLYDEIMLLHAQEGGEPTPFELARLRHYGFAGNPEERLLELMKEPRRR